MAWAVSEYFSRGGGGRLQYKNAWMCVLGSENVPILKDTLGKKKYTHIEGFRCILHRHIMVRKCIKRKCIIPKGHSQFIIF